MAEDDLSRKLRRLAFLNEQGDMPPRYANRLNGEADFILRRLERDAALRDLAKLMPDSSRGSNRWAVAGRLVEALERFETTAWPRIQSGARPPRTALERHLTRVLEYGQLPCRRLIWEALKPRSAVLESPFIERAVSMATG